MTRFPRKSGKSCLKVPGGNLVKLLTVLSLLLCVSFSQASETQLGFDFDSSGLKYDSNVAPAVKQQMEDDIDFVQSINGSKATPLYLQIFGEMNGTVLTKWLLSRVKAVGYEERDDGAVAYVMRLMPWKMWLTQNFVQFSHPAIARLMIVYHEARHTEVKHGNFSHATCPTPFLDEQGKDMKSIWTGRLLQGEPACDVTPFGSYGSSTIMLKNVAMNCETCSEKVKMDADLYAADQIGRVTNAKAKEQMKQDFGVQ